MDLAAMKEDVLRKLYDETMAAVTETTKHKEAFELLRSAATIFAIAVQRVEYKENAKTAIHEMHMKLLTDLYEQTKLAVDEADTSEVKCDLLSIASNAFNFAFGKAE